jgi:metal-sulfur cluster biosynthetic enzyme
MHALRESPWRHGRSDGTLLEQSRSVTTPALRERVLEALHQVDDPAFGFNIVDLGLIHDVEIEGGHVHVAMTLPAASPGEPIVAEATARVRAVDGVEAADVDIVPEPPWGPERMSEVAREALGIGAR